MREAVRCGIRQRPVKHVALDRSGTPPAVTGATMTRDQLAAELKRIATDQVSDIERAVKDGHKTIALNEIADLNRNLKALAAAVKGKGLVRA
nr:hypothetical protein [Methylobacterium sp. Leaf117]